MDGTLVKSSQPRQLLSKLLEEPELVAIVRALEAPVLGRLIRHVGLEDAGELVALASTPQLARVFDEDLWQLDEPGQNEAFDAQRFTTWLDIMLEAGPTFAARRLLEMDEDMVVFALSEHLRAIDSERVAATMWKGASAGCDQLLQQALDSQQYHEFEQFLVYSIHEPSWGTWLPLLLELERLQHNTLVRWLERLADISADTVDDEDDEVDGYYHALRRAETLADDVAAQRSERREQEGYVTPSDARSFLRLAARSSLVEILAARGADPITQAYFRDYFASPGLQPAADQASATARTPAAEGAAASASTTQRDPVSCAREGHGVRDGDACAQPVGAGPGAATADDPVASATATMEGAAVATAAVPSPAVARWLDALREVGAAPQAAQRLLPATTSEPAPELPVRAAMLALRLVDPALYSRRVIELSYLANILLAGAHCEGRSFRPVEAAEAALALSNLGFERALGRTVILRQGESDPRATAWLTRHDLVTAFRAGVHIAHQELAQAASRALRTRLQRSASCTPGSARSRQFSSLAAALAQDSERQEPWRSCARLDALEGVLAPQTLAAFRNLLAECPTLPPQFQNASPATSSRFVTHADQVDRIAKILAHFERGPKHSAPPRPV